jgi:MFS family permease
LQDEIAQPRPRPEAAPTAYAWLVLAMLWFVYVLNFLDRQLLSILAKPIQDSLGVTDGQLGLITGLYFALFYCLISIPVGWLADRTNRVKVLAIACGVWSAATAGCGAAANYGQLVGARMMVGVGEAGGVPPSYAIISDYFPPGRRGTALGIFNLGPPIGQALGVAFGAAIAVSLSWRHAFYILGAIGILAAIVVYFGIREPVRGGLDRTPTIQSPRQASGSHADVFSPTQHFCWRRLAAARPSSSPMDLAISRCCSCSARKA